VYLNAFGWDEHFDFFAALARHPWIVPGFRLPRRLPDPYFSPAASQRKKGKEKRKREEKRGHRLRQESLGKGDDMGKKEKKGKEKKGTPFAPGKLGEGG